MKRLRKTLTLQDTLSAKATGLIQGRTCDRIDCEDKAINIIHESAGKLGIISLYLCNRCLDDMRKVDDGL